MKTEKHHVGQSSQRIGPSAPSVPASVAVPRPPVVSDDHLEYLDDLRESGITNMYGAVPYLREAFDLSRQDASAILSYWMKSFSERHP